MTEQEIVDYLKENKNKGVAFGFMPEDVQDWVQSHRRECVYLNADGMWEETTRHTSDIKDIWASDICALAESYLPSKKGGEWVEFEIDQRGNFHCFIDGDMHYFFWANWNVFLFEADSSGYTAFGGWQYKDDSLFYMYPVVNFYKDDPEQHCVPNHAQAYDGETDDVVEPAIPQKIRFWRKVK